MPDLCILVTNVTVQAGQINVAYLATESAQGRQTFGSVALDFAGTAAAVNNAVEAAAITAINAEHGLAIAKPADKVFTFGGRVS